MSDSGRTMVACLSCGHTNPLGTEVCPRCGAGAAETLMSAPTLQGSPTMQGTAVPSSKPPRRPATSDDESQRPVPGDVLADRYEVISTLGVGGMGAVFKVFDRRLTRVVALKTIHPELAATPMMMKRFKQEVLLAQKITHKNVVRIFDIGEDQGTTFITMDFIEGVSLKDVIVERGKFEPKAAVAMIREICLALEAAHSEGVIHRDLKPQNIMIDKDQHVVVMDFGIARSAESGGATQTGALLGTPDYMSPEQARMEDVDARSDIFALGLIFFELLTARLPFQGKTVVESLFLRTKERAIPTVEIDRNIPKGANDIVAKCLEPDREKRYASVTEMLNDLETFDPTKKVGAAVRVKSRLRKHKLLAGIAAGVVVLLGGSYVLRNNFRLAPPEAHANVAVVIADFTNRTGDASFDSAVERVTKLALEQAAFISAFDSGQSANLGVVSDEVDKENADGVTLSDGIDELEAQKIAIGQGIGFFVSGSLEKQDSQYVIAVKAREAVSGKTIFEDKATAASKDKVLSAATNLAASVRAALGDDTSDSTQRFAMDALSATTLEAVREYATAMELLSNNNNIEALKHFTTATDLDKEFGLAWAGMAVTKDNLREPEAAEKFMETALAKIDRMTEREKYRTRALSFNLRGNRDKCIEEYGELIRRFPADVSAHNNRASCLSQMRNLKAAVDEQRQAVDILPKRPLYRNNLAVHLAYGGDFDNAEVEVREVQKLDPASDTSFVVLAFAQLARGQSVEALDTYKQLQAIAQKEANPRRAAVMASKAASGQADIALYEGRYNDAVRLLEQGASADLTANNKDRAAMKLAVLAYTHLQQGQKQQASAAAEKALANSKNFKIRFLAGLAFVAAGQDARAKEMMTSLAGDVQPEYRAYAKIIEGETLLESGKAGEAIPLFTDANGLLDTWIGRFELGKAYLEAGRFTEAQSEFDRCMTRRGEALALFLDENPTYGFFPSVHYYMGRTLEGMKSSSFADHYRTYLSIREKAGDDPLIAEARKRIK